MTRIDPAEIARQAAEELDQERRRELIELEKQKIRSRPPGRWWHRFFPWEISIKRRS